MPIPPLTPPFCPNPRCRFHQASDVSGWNYQSRGSRAVQRSPRPVRMFSCCHCRRWFCDAAFTSDYWKKKPHVMARAYPLICDGQALRQAGRVLGVAVTTIKRAERQLAKQSLLIHLRQERALTATLREPIVLDGARSFAGSQNEPAEVNGIFTADSGLCLELRAFGLRRSGSMTAAQRQRREQRDQRLGRPDPQARRRLAQQALLRLAGLFAPRTTIEVRTDEEPGYRPAIEALARQRAVRHVSISGSARRDSDNPLWMANHKHRVQRHCLASWRRETIAHHKNLSGLQDRQLLHRVWLNNTKGVSERRQPDQLTTPAMQHGLTEKRLTALELFFRRGFPVREQLPEVLRPLYEGTVKARPRESSKPYIHSYAY